MSRWEERVWGGGDAQGRAVYKGGQMSEGAAQGRSLEIKPWMIMLIL